MYPFIVLVRTGVNDRRTRVRVKIWYEFTDLNVYLNISVDVADIFP